MPVSYSFSLASSLKASKHLSATGGHSGAHGNELSVGGVIRGDVHLPVATIGLATAGGCSDQMKGSHGKLPLVIYCHGFKGFKDWGFVPWLAESISERGAAVIRFNYSLNGIGSDLENFTELENFKQNTMAQEAADLLQVIEKVREGSLPMPAEIDPSNLILIGHSRGGVAVLRTAAQSGNDIALKRVILLASVSRYPEFSPEERKEWRERGFRSVENTRTGQQLPCGLGLLDEIEQGNGEVERFARAVSVPALIIHGDQDTSVKPESADQLASWIPKNTLKILHGADHAFNATHPFKVATPHLKQIVELVAVELSQVLKEPAI